MKTMVLSLSFISITLIISIILNIIYFKKKYILRLTKYLDHQYEEEKGLSTRETLRKTLEVISKRVSGIFRLKKLTNRYSILLLQSDIPLKGDELFLILFLIFLVTSFLSFLVTSSIINSLIVGIILYYTPIILLKSRTSQRIKEIDNQLGDAIVLISNSLRAGYSFLQAIETVSDEMPDPINREFKILLKEMNLGLTTQTALNNLVNRVQSRDLDLMVTAVLIQRQVGGNLSEILDNISTTIRQRVKLKGEVKTLTAQGRMSGWIISFLPVALGGILFFMNREYISLLITNPLGNGMLLLGTIMQAIGMILIRRIVSIEM